jgi:hypothetical protein
VVTDRAEIVRHLTVLASNKKTSAYRMEVCTQTTRSLAQIGRHLWVQGYFIGPHRASGSSPYNYGDDRVVGVATVAQIAGELGGGAIDLLRASNQYAAACLVRQLVEVEYLAHAFAADDKVAAEWLRADRSQRRKFWTPERLRERSRGRFLPRDYWSHCDRGGHPTVDGMGLLPDHISYENPLQRATLWTDLAGHLESTWRKVITAAERHIADETPADWGVAEARRAINAWRANDDFNAAMSNLDAIRREDPDAFHDAFGFYYGR